MGPTSQRRGAGTAGTSPPAPHHRVPNPFARLQVGSAGANFADGMSLVAFPLVAAAFTSSPLAIAAVSAARSLPWLLVSLHVGLLIDRRGPGRLLLHANTVRGGVFLALTLLLVWPNDAVLLLLGLIAFVAGVLEVVADNSTQTLLPELVPAARLPAANARIQLIENTGLNFVGAPVASILATLHLAAPVALICGLYCGAAATLRGVAGPRRAAGSRGEPGAVLAGWRYIRRSQALFTLAMSTSLMNFVAGGTTAILVLYVQQRLHAPAWTYGPLLTALAVGSLLGAMAAPRALARTSESTVLRCVLVTLPVPMFVIAVTTNFWVAAGAQVMIGALEVTWGVVAVSFRQEVVPQELLGRVNAAYRMAAWGSIPIGAFLAGGLAEFAGVLGSYLCLTAVLCAGWFVAVTIRPEVLNRERRSPAVHHGERQGEQ